jgi:predicted HicB family RNase H-like nuclease
MMEYEGYLARVEFDDEADIFHGEVVNIRDVVTFQGRTVSQLRKAFRDSVDDYIAFCRERGEPPEKPYSGHFVVRISPELHRAVSIAAARKGRSLNAWVARQLADALNAPSAPNEITPPLKGTPAGRA